MSAGGVIIEGVAEILSATDVYFVQSRIKKARAPLLMRAGRCQPRRGSVRDVLVTVGLNKSVLDLFRRAILARNGCCLPAIFPAAFAFIRI